MRHLIEIGGMTCGGCARAVENALRRLPEVRSVEIDLPAGRAVVDAGTDTPAPLIAAIEDAGYDARPAGGGR